MERKQASDVIFMLLSDIKSRGTLRDPYRRTVRG